MTAGAESGQPLDRMKLLASRAGGGYDRDARALLGAHKAFLRACNDLLNEWRLVSHGPGQTVAHALASRVQQNARALHVLLEAGYAAECGPILRATASVAVALLYIADQDPDGRARAFILQGLRERRARLPDLVSVGSIEERRAQTFHERLDTEIAALEAAADHGLVATKLGASPRTWHGLGSEMELCRRMDVYDWYVRYYRPFSDETHATLNGLTDEIDDTVRGYGISGPHFDDPDWAVEASMDFASQSLAQLDGLFGLDAMGGIEQVVAPLARALGKFRLERDPKSHATAD